MKNMTNNELQKMIDKTDYWDAEILDMKASYFGDVVEIYIDNDEETCWKVSFLSCYKVLYETDANRRKIINVKDMKKPQLGYFAQDISVSRSKIENFYIVKLDLSIMEMQIECRDIQIGKIAKKDILVFWK